MSTKPKVSNQAIIIKNDVAHYYENEGSIEVYIWAEPASHKQCVKTRIPFLKLQESMKRIESVRRAKGK